MSGGFEPLLICLPICLILFALGQITDHLEAIRANTYAMYLQLTKKPADAGIWFCQRCGIGNDSSSNTCKNCGEEKK